MNKIPLNQKKKQNQIGFAQMILKTFLYHSSNSIF
jgi:hypothetical protein